MITRGYVTAGPCCHSVSPFSNPTQASTGTQPVRVPFTLKYPSAKLQHAEPSGSAAAASDLSNWLLATTYYSCMMKTKNTDSSIKDLIPPESVHNEMK